MKTIHHAAVLTIRQLDYEAQESISKTLRELQTRQALDNGFNNMKTEWETEYLQKHSSEDLDAPLLSMPPNALREKQAMSGYETIMKQARDNVRKKSRKKQRTRPKQNSSIEKKH